MANFQYTALDAKGEQTTGAIVAATEADAIQQLRSKGLYPTQIDEEGNPRARQLPPKASHQGARQSPSPRASTGGRIKPKSLMIFTRQLATLIDSGLPLLRGLTVLAKQEPNPVLRGTISALADIGAGRFHLLRSRLPSIPRFSTSSTSTW